MFHLLREKNEKFEDLSLIREQFGKARVAIGIVLSLRLLQIEKPESFAF